ncbi:A-kinase anchor protein 11 isoform X2 [Pithys albifrons albifrons]|uniref:A-kinase anchor protein 11 isoform X2 n=1 Tax=Pithys albifrons albifrons TaxID=3385563 RepID=UPI003A5CDA35
MDMYARAQGNQRKPRISVKKSFGEGVLHSMKSLLQSRKELCNISAEECLNREEDDNFIEISFIGFAEEMGTARLQDLSAVSVELPDVLKSLQLHKLKENEAIFLKDVKKTLAKPYVMKHQNQLPEVFCVMRLSPSFPRIKVDYIFTLLSKYTTGIRYAVETNSLQKHQTETSHGEDDDTNQSVSSIEDDFVTAFEHLDEDEPSKMQSAGAHSFTSQNHRDAASQTIPAQCLEAVDSKIPVDSAHRKSSARSSTLIDILGLKELSSVKNSVTTSISDPWIQRSFYKPYNPSDQGVNFLRKTFFSSSPAESSESDCSSPSPIIFLDEEGYQKSLKAKLQLPKIPVVKDGIEDSDSEVSEFFDSFDQFDELEQALENSCKIIRGPILGNPSQKRRTAHEKLSSASITMNPQKFKFDRPTLPANVMKPTPRKPESPYSSIFEVPDSPRPVKTSGEESGDFFSPIRTSAFSPLGSCGSSECLCRSNLGGDGTGHSHFDAPYNSYSAYADSVSFEILGSVFSSESSSEHVCAGDESKHKRSALKEKKRQATDLKVKTGKEPDKQAKSKQKSLMIRDSIQKFAAELVEKSFGSAFKDLQKGVSSCTNALCHLAARLTSSVFQMAFYEIGRRRAISLKERAINGIANFLVSEAITGALKELRQVKKQIFTNTVARFAADLAEELVFEGIMEVCQFSYPSTPTAAPPSSFDYENKVVKSYARDLSESVIQEAFIELSQVDVTFTTQAAISVSMDNIKYVSAESMLESTQTSTVFPSLNDRVALKPIPDTKKEYTVQQALFCTSGVISSIPVPLAGRVLCQQQVSSDAYRAKVSAAPNADDNMKVFKDSTHPFFTSKKREQEVSSFRNIYLTSDHNQSTEGTSSLFCNQNDTKLTNNRPGMTSGSELTSGSKGINTFSGTMVDMIVNEAYEAITSSRVTKAAEEYTDYLTRKIVDKNPYVQGIGEDFPKNIFADHLAKYVIKHSVDESKTVLRNTSDNLTCNVSSPACGDTKQKEQCEIKKQESEKQSNVSIIVEQQQLPLNNPCKFLTPTHSVQCFSESKDCWQEQKGHRFSAKSPPPCSTVTFAKHILEDCTDTGSCSISCLNKPSKKNDAPKLSAGALNYRQADCFLHANSFSSAMLGSESALQMEEKSSLKHGNTCLMPDTPPPTPLVPCQGTSERNLRKLSKKLKGELAKEFSPATPPSTPYNPSITGLSESEPDSLENEEFMLKLMRSLSEEVESSEDEDHSQIPVEKGEHLEKTIQYADCLANHIVSIATEVAASHLDGKTNERDAGRRVQLGVQKKLCGYTAFKNIPEETRNSLWNYAGDVAGEVINEAKKVVKSRHCKLLRLKRVNCQVDCLYLRKGDKDGSSKEWCGSVQDQWLRVGDSSVLPLPQGSGLTSKYPSCESVTDEYADHVIRVLKREGGSAELLMEQYASRLAYRSIKSGLQQAARKTKLRYNRKVFAGQNAQVTGKLELIKVVNKDAMQQVKSSIHCCEGQTYERSVDTQRTECTELLHFSESLAHSITCDVRKKLKMSGACLPKSLTDSCLYQKTEFDEVTGDLIKRRLSRTFLPFSPDHKLYHSTGSVNENGYTEGIIQAIEQYARKVADDTLEMSLESALLHVAENNKNGDKLLYTEKLSPFSGTVCRCCSMKEHRYCTESMSHHLPAQESCVPGRHLLYSGLSGACQNARVFQLDIPKIHVDVEQRTVFSDKGATASVEKGERELSYTSLTADSGIGQDGVSFAESLTTEIMTSAMTNIGQAVTISQQMSLSIGDDSTGSWSNLSFEDEHPDESSSFLHLSDSNGNSSSWSSLGLEGDMYEENLSFPTSDSDGTEDKDDDSKDAVEGLEQIRKTLSIANIDLERTLVDPQLRAALQWLAASETEVSDLHLRDTASREFVFLSRRLRERDWKVGDLLQAVLKYCEMIEKASDGEQALTKSFVSWLMESA